MIRRMATKELREKYGKSTAEQAVNAAIRAELPGGAALLDALEIAHKAAGRYQTGGTSRGDDPAAATVGRVLAALRAAKGAMEDEIRRRYDMPPREGA